MTLPVPQWGETIVSLDELMRQKHWSDESINRAWRTHDLMCELFSGRYRGSGRPTVNHLCGTAYLALRYGGSVDETLAGLAHAAYQQGDFGRASGTTPTNRAELRAVIGPQAEALVANYDSFGFHTFASQKTPADVEALDLQERSILFLQTVNSVEDGADCHVYPEKWVRGFLDRMRAGVGFAEMLGYPDLARDVGAIADHVETNAIWAPKGNSRPKRSRTLTPRTPPVSNKGRFGLRSLAKRIVARLRRLSGS